MVIQKIHLFIEECSDIYHEWSWKISPERKELASERLAAHELAIKEGRASPYRNPELYDLWNQKTSLSMIGV